MSQGFRQDLGWGFVLLRHLVLGCDGRAGIVGAGVDFAGAVAGEEFGAVVAVAAGARELAEAVDVECCSSRQCGYSVSKPAESEGKSTEVVIDASVDSSCPPSCSSWRYQMISPKQLRTVTSCHGEQAPWRDGKQGS